MVVVEPIANSSMLVFSQENSFICTQIFDNMCIINRGHIAQHLEEQVVRRPLVEILSLIAPGTPASGAISSPAAIFSINFSDLCQSIFFI